MKIYILSYCIELFYNWPDSYTLFSPFWPVSMQSFGLVTGLIAEGATLKIIVKIKKWARTEDQKGLLYKSEPHWPFGAQKGSFKKKFTPIGVHKKIELQPPRDGNNLVTEQAIVYFDQVHTVVAWVWEPASQTPLSVVADTVWIVPS